ncbi:MAG TPA: isocitrate lyase/phosphoenolpyruvate mutase family protein [Candidatus Binatia bacterium]|nr:isocitrate lyase/phosphoenolpyruvate mutase family protein [Candidatus Binatia bacterium]
MPSIADKRRSFRALHRTGCFVLPNPWDVGTARYLQHLGFQAIATTSSGAAFSMGLPDGAVPLDVMLAHIRSIVEASDLPVNADFQSGYAEEPEQVAANVRRCIETGVAGLSIEDLTGDPARPFYPLELATRRIAAARAAIDAAGGEVILTGRTEWKLTARSDLDEAIRRLRAFADAGADCLFAPGLGAREEIAAAVEAVAPRPLNAIVSAASGLTVGDLAALGVRRISVGSSLARVAWGAFIRAARAIASEGSFDAFADAVPFPELNAFLRDDAKRRRSS